MKIAVIGAGAMGGAMVEGFIKGGIASAADVNVSAPHTATLEKYAALGANVTTDNCEAARGADIVVVAVKPWMVESVVGGIKPVLDYGKQTIVSVAAGVSGDKLKEYLAKDGCSLPEIFIAIPNIAIAEGSSMTYIVPVNAVDAASTDRINGLFGKLGGTVVLEERLLDAAVKASCSIAYVMRYARASMEGLVQLGFRAADARNIALQTMKGAVELLLADGNHPEAEIDRVTTPGGFTIRGLNEMERAGFTNAVIRGVLG